MQQHKPGMILEGRYRLDRQVGEGGFGVVYAGWHLVLDTPVAIKLSRLSAHAEAESSLAFLDEAKLLSRLRHPNIVRVLDAGLLPANEHRPLQGWLVFEWCEGTTLAAHLEKIGRKRMPRDEAWRLMRPVTEAVATLHDAGVVHRDLKPANVMLVDEAGTLVPRLIDFGIAKRFDETGSDEATRERTTGGATSYTPSYAAPEQLTGMRTGPWTDVHALGLMLVELLIGERAYGKEVEPATVLDQTRPTPKQRGVDAGAWEDVLGRALSLRVGARHPNARALLTELDQALPEPGSTPHSSAPRASTPETARTAAPPFLGGRNMAFSLLTVGGRRISIALHTKRAPSDDEWRDWIALLDQVGPEVQWDLSRAPNLVFTDGGAPDTSQRTAVNMRVAQGKTLPAVAVVTQSMLVRVMARGFSIFNPNVRVFAPEDLDAAVAHVGFAPKDARELLSAAINLEGKVLGAGAVETLSAVTRTRG